jgi:hypothetical protein
MHKLLTGVAIVFSCACLQAQSLAQTSRATGSPRDMLAAQIRTQGFACKKALHARRDARRSRADHDVWVLTCSNATYRVGLVPDMAASVKQLR